MTRTELAKRIDHTLLKAEATEKQVQDAVLFAKKEHTATVCLLPCWVPMASEILKDSGVGVCTVVGFPLGANSSLIKAKEAEELYAQGAAELDMVINVGALKSGMVDLVLKDIKAVVDASPARVKVILETCYLTREEIVTACKLSVEAGAAYVKTSTGFGPAGAKVDDVKLMRASVPDNVKVKAAGGIGSYVDALVMIEAGARRIGASRTAAILDEADTAGQG
ncbi:deoxyribose-phosphate aldolase [Ruminococcaceae bacterium OttesenSCG-928-D13]|nr:deoxyribose-phosphate aldolase [Ruminococcaceae bacterium OttesenSCG-928-D13]